jgi:hypothetical protein
MSVPDFEHEFDAEAEACFQQFKSDSIPYLMRIGQLYNEELERLQIEYTKVYQDELLEYNERWRKLYDIRKDRDLNKRLRRGIKTLIYLKTPLCAKNCTYKEDRQHLSSQNLRTQKFHYGIAKLRRENPGMTEEEAIQRMKDERGYTRPGVHPNPLSLRF